MTRLFVIWNESYSVGNELIDTQHQKLIEIINNLYESFVDQTTAYKLEKIINDLIDYSNYHFKTEEDFFEKHDYPEKEIHIAKHQHFIQKVNDFNNQFKEGKANLTFQLMNFLRNWLLTHINGDDKEYSIYFWSKNVR